jgi:hypothetical protein
MWRSECRRLLDALKALTTDMPGGILFSSSQAAMPCTREMLSESKKSDLNQDSFWRIAKEKGSPAKQAELQLKGNAATGADSRAK